MHWSKNLPHLVSAFITVVGLFFITAGFILPSFLELKAPGSYYLLGLSVLFVAIGILTSYLRYRGKLKRIGITTEDIRQETISKLKDEQLLAKIALKDKNEETRQAAAERLQEIKD